MPQVSRRPILDRIMEGSIETNYLIFPPQIGEFQRDPVLVYDGTNEVHLPFAFYSKGNQLGIVYLEDLWHGLRQVRALEWEPQGSKHQPAATKVTPSTQILYAE